MVELQNVNDRRNLVGKILIYSQAFFSFKYILAKTKTNKQTESVSSTFFLKTCNITIP